VITVGFGAVAGVTADELLAAIDAVLPPDIDDVRLTTLAARAAEAGPVTAGWWSARPCTAG
jgi:cobalt-precorrin 5A hydrolase